MNEDKKRLVNEMFDKLTEAKIYANISLSLTILFFLDTILTLLGYLQFNAIYFMVLFVTFIGNQHMSRKNKQAIEEYEKLKEDYEDLFKTTDS